MGRFVLEDLTGTLPVTLFANQLQQFGHQIADDIAILVKGQVRERGTDVELTVEEIIPLEKLNVRPVVGVDVTLNGTASQTVLLKLKDIFIEHPGDAPVTLKLKLPDRTFHISAKESYKIEFGPELKANIEKLLGQGTVHERYQSSAA
jgi:DNA polymerase III alpha subunit